MEYKIIAETYSKIESTTKRLEMTDYLVELFHNTPEDVIDKVIYLTQGKLYPDYMGIELGLAEKLAMRGITKATGIKEKTLGEMLKKYGDLGSVAEEAIKKKRQTTLFSFEEEKNLTVEKVYENFEKIAKAEGPGSQDRKIQLLAELLNLAKPIEAKYIVRTVEGKLRLGIADMTILDALSIAYGRTKELRSLVERTYNIHPDLGYIAKKLAKEGIDGVKDIKIELGIPIRAMLAERLPSLEEILAKMGGKAAFEYKYDGMRIQGHVGKDKVWLYSRRLENLTSQFPDVVEALKEAFQGKEGIFDGEAVPVDIHTGELLPFQVVSHRRGRKYEIEKAIEDYPVVLFLFDIIYLDGEDLTSKPYPERRKILERVINPTERVKFAHRIVSSDIGEIREFFNKAIEDGCEGLVAKSIGKESIYRAGAREFLWIKYKRDYKVEMGDTVDLVVVGAFAGKGKRKGTYGALLMAAYNPEKDRFETVCKLGSGFTDEQLAYLPRKFEDLKIENKHPRVWSEMEADYWFVPKVVLEVIGAEITLSPTHTCARDVIEKGTGLAIRFPRFTGRWRDDKSPEEATTTKELIEMYKNQIKKIR
ncbi:ATP-dependent DNA ligase [Candidatus Aciduliprofundum boonei]|uniref:DNA ligase n=1 Tax=Aciduliprofundum boonei (strain DSM 19572 / T469) TaxID=439481 RepID=B5IAL8_ACIB4|nr:ATP-dependent DNA ligase [Candidatus Aciduliprofundum boonei]ADD08623.1 DNA ligase I, ATP-dependent Dnl1 [Aciduliprofundum boonei T469]EDY36765.1 DNA ligase I, ATP-dependent superfamily [Aciduliprofundum boonei T469]HII54822.1 ATP-dependent DNA ligase [Candidatus Aciduliprofundum boonei]